MNLCINVCVNELLNVSMSSFTLIAFFICPLIPLTVLIAAPSNFATSSAVVNIP